MTDPPEFNRLELMERGSAGGDFAGFAAFDDNDDGEQSSDNFGVPGLTGYADVDDYIDEEAPISRSSNNSSFGPYGQISPKFLSFADQSRDNRPDPLPDRNAASGSSPVDLDETVITAAALPTPQMNNRSSRTRAHMNLSSSHTALSSRHILRERAKEKEKKTKLTKSGGGQQPRKKYNPSLPEPKKDDKDSCTARCWPGFSFFCTCLIPSCLICKDGKAAKQAWREKVTIFEIMLVFDLIFLIIFGAIPLYFCREVTPLDDYDWYQTIIEPTCLALNYVMYGILFFTAGILLLQCLCSLILAAQSLHMKMGYSKFVKSSDCRQKRLQQDSAIMIMVPCYNEGETELRKTIKSILETDYPQENKVLVVVADGIITGKGEWMNTPLHLSKILGFKVSRKDPGYAYKSIGGKGENRASVYSGVYTSGQRTLKYMCVIKRGTPDEKDSSRPGNRGKRDSQLLLMGMLNRVHYDRRPCELDEAMVKALNGLQIPPTEIEYMMAIDADTRVSKLSMSYMHRYLQANNRVLACCGETKVDNKTASWVTMIQPYEYFASHALKKSFESIFGCVTCLPGCFTMLRIYCPDDMRPLLSSDNVFQAYSRNDIDSLHDKNLFHLGEDRMLTTLLLKYFPEYRLNFVPAAACWTIVPDTYKVLLSQRRRWINSTFHNMWELLKVRTLCGCCCLSMKAVVAIDMLSTMILPAAMLYGLSFIYIVFVAGEPISQLTLILFGVILGAQVLIFLVRSRIDHLFWFFIYLVLGLPVFFFILPLYSMWNMDDLSWGTTRQVADKKPASPSSSK